MESLTHQSLEEFLEDTKNSNPFQDSLPEIVDEHLSGFHLDNLEELQKLIKLVHSDHVGHAKISKIPDISTLPLIQHLDLSDCNLIGCPEALQHLLLLEYLDISGNHFIARLPTNLSQCKKLKHLDVSGCGLTECPSVIGKLSSLEHLNLSTIGSLTTLPQSLGQLSKLKSLYVILCNLYGCPYVVSQLKSLTHLALSGNCELTSLPDGMENLKNLEYLDVSNCGLTSYPNVLNKLTTIRHVKLNGNSILHLPLGMAHLLKLQHLDVSRCKLTSIPEILFELGELTTVNLSRNEIKFLPSVAIEKIWDPYYEDYWCWDPEKLVYPPYQVYRQGPLRCKEYLQGAKVIRAASKSISTFPNLVGYAQLVVVDVSHNRRITKLPVSLVGLPNIKYIKARGCSLQKVPSFLCQMTHLKHVDLRRNEITNIPACCIQYWNLTKNFIQHSDNPQPMSVVYFNSHYLQAPPKLVFDQGVSACVEYYREIVFSDAKNTGIHTINVLGKFGAGKTSLIRTIQNQQSTLVAEDERTVVVDRIKIRRGDNVFFVNDFGGHDIYELTSSLFLRKDNQFVLVVVNLNKYSREKHDELVTRWLSGGIAHMRSGKIAVVATNQDLCSEEEVDEKVMIMEELIANWKKDEVTYLHKKAAGQSLVSNVDQALELLSSQEFPIFVTSSKSGSGIANLEKFLLHKANRAKSTLPATWVKLYRKIDELQSSQNYEGDFKDWLTMAEVRKLFMKLTPVHKRLLINIDSRLTQCLEFFHNSGIILWYKENKDLQDVIFYGLTFLIQSLKCLFHHNLVHKLEYSPQCQNLIPLKADFDLHLSRFTLCGILTRNLLQCIWADMKLSESTHEKMEAFLVLLDLCYVEKQICKKQLKKVYFRFPWFLQQKNDEYSKYLQMVWPKKVPLATLEFAVFYEFFHRIPATLYERICVRLHHTLPPGGHVRKDVKDEAYIKVGAVQLLIEKITKSTEAMIKLTFRCPVRDLTEFGAILQKIYNEINALIREYPSIVTNAYFHCPHCNLTGSVTPIRSPLSILEEKPLEHQMTVPCDPYTTGVTEDIPAALVYPQLFGKYSGMIYKF